MNVISSIRQLSRVLSQDRQLAKLGVGRGWYASRHYLGRFRNRFGLASKETQGRFRVSDKEVIIHLMPEQLSTLYGVFGDNEYDLSQLISAAPDTILDLGANSGMAAVYLHAHYPHAKIACVEPDPRNINLLHKTLASNQLRDSIKVFPAAIASKPGQLKLRMGENSTCSALETSPMHDLADSTMVEVTTVPLLLEQLGWERINLLKVDIEGTEDELFSIDNSWLNRIDALVLEIHPNTTPEKIQSYLAPFGFTIKPLLRGIEPVFFVSRASKN